MSLSNRCVVKRSRKCTKFSEGSNGYAPLINLYNNNNLYYASIIGTSNCERRERKTRNEMFRGFNTFIPD